MPLTVAQYMMDENILGVQNHVETPKSSQNSSQSQEPSESGNVISLFRKKVIEPGTHTSPITMMQGRVLDLCAGCGVIGMELNYHLPMFNRIDFLEVQSNYHDDFLANRERVKKEHPRLKTDPSYTDQLQFEWHERNYSGLLRDPSPRQYDLILSNPPYFLPNQGELSPSEFKNRCRFYIDSDFKSLVETIMHVLTPEGHAFVMLRELEDHGHNLLRELGQLTKDKLEVENIGMVRTSFLLHLFRKSI